MLQEPIKPHEKRALNFLVHEYFMQQGDKLTAITLTEENGDQDFDDWDDVGLNIPKPPDLLYLFRNYSTFMLSDREKLERIKNLVRDGGHYCAAWRGAVSVRWSSHILCVQIDACTLFSGGPAEYSDRPEPGTEEGE